MLGWLVCQIVTQKSTNTYRNNNLHWWSTRRTHNINPRENTKCGWLIHVEQSSFITKLCYFWRTVHTGAFFTPCFHYYSIIFLTHLLIKLFNSFLLRMCLSAWVWTYNTSCISPRKWCVSWMVHCTIYIVFHCTSLLLAHPLSPPLVVSCAF